MSSELLAARDPGWSEFLQGAEHDVYQLPGYVRLHCTAPGDEAMAYLYRGERGDVLFPLIIRDIPGTDLRDAASPYVYSGPVSRIDPTGSPHELLTDATGEMLSSFATEGIVTAFIRLHPFIGVDAEDVSGVGTLIHHGETVAIDLTQSPEMLWSQTRQNHKRNIKRSIRDGHHAYPDADWRHFETFLEIYQETMRRVNDDPAYTIDRDYFSRHRRELGSHLHLWVVEIDGTIAEAALFTETDGILQYHFAGSRNEYSKAHPSKLLLHEVSLWGRERGNRLLNLGGGVGGENDSVFDFKIGFSKLTYPVHTWRLIADEHRYRQLNRDHGVAGEPGADEGSGFFPAYRQTGVRVQPGQLAV